MTLDPLTRRLAVRAAISNDDGQLRPEMFAMVDIITTVGHESPSLPRSALIYDGENTYVWRVRQDKSIERRSIKVGSLDGDRVQIIDGISASDIVVAKGSLFIDRVATAAE